MNGLVARICGAGLVLGWATAAGAASFTMQPIGILGTSQVAATGINDAGTIVGTVLMDNTPIGFVEQASSLWLLEGSPTSINAAGQVVGLAGNQGFVWQNGTITSRIPYEAANVNGGLVPPVINRRAELGFSATVGQAQLGFAGQANAIHQVKGLSNTSAIVLSINDRGVLAGYERVTIQGQQQQAVFVGRHGVFDLLLSPRLQSVVGGYVNNAGAVAFTDLSNGYVVTPANGETRTFPLPAGAENMQITAINNGGRVVGTFTDTTQMPSVQRAFLYQGTTFSTFGSFAAGDVVTVSLNDRGAILVSDASSNGGAPKASYLVRCHGEGC